MRADEAEREALAAIDARAAQIPPIDVTVTVTGATDEAAKVIADAVTLAVRDLVERPWYDEGAGPGGGTGTGTAQPTERADG